MNCIDCEYALNFEAVSFIECKHPKVLDNTTNSCFDGKTHPKWCPLSEKDTNNSIMNIED